uniref:Protein SEC13 homolog n=1 Tax=Chrysotila carterae TaxID=13221 RepID=A0A7S4F6D3_CHRCT
MQKVATAHEDLIHDAQLDYYGKRLATCSSDRTIKVYDVFEGGERKQVADLTGHDGPVWQVCWAHPKFGNILASCSYDRQILVWKEVGPGQWAVIYKYAKHAQSGTTHLLCACMELGTFGAVACGEQQLCSFKGAMTLGITR